MRVVTEAVLATDVVAMGETAAADVDDVNEVDFGDVVDDDVT